MSATPPPPQHGRPASRTTPVTTGAVTGGDLPTWLVPHRDLGPLDGVLGRPGRLPLPQVVLLLVACGLLVVPVLAQVIVGRHHAIGVPGEGATPLGPVWVWAAAAVALAALAMLGRSLRRLDWPVPGLLRAVEYGTVLQLVGASPWAYLLLAVLAAHHYGIVYRVRSSAPGSSTRSSMLAGGWPVRCTVLVVAAATDTVAVAVAVLALALVPVVATDAVRSWLRLAP